MHANRVSHECIVRFGYIRNKLAFFYTIIVFKYAQILNKEKNVNAKVSSFSKINFVFCNNYSNF